MDGWIKQQGDGKIILKRVLQSTAGRMNWFGIGNEREREAAHLEEGERGSGKKENKEKKRKKTLHGWR